METGAEYQYIQPTGDDEPQRNESGSFVRMKRVSEKIQRFAMARYRREMYHALLASLRDKIKTGESEEEYKKRHASIVAYCLRRAARPFLREQADQSGESESRYRVQWEHQRMPAELAHIFRQLEEAGISYDDLEEYASGGYSRDGEKLMEILLNIKETRMSDGIKHLEGVLQSMGEGTEEYAQTVHRLENFKEEHRDTSKRPGSVVWADRFRDRAEIKTREQLLAMLEREFSEMGGAVKNYVDTAAGEFLVEREDDGGEKKGVQEVIPDGIASPLLYSIHNLHNMIKGKLYSEGAIQSPQNLNITGRNPEHIKQAIEKQQDIMRRNAKIELYTFIVDWQEKNPHEEVSPERMEAITQIRDIILDGTDQMSESTEKWILLYALEATRGTDSAKGTFSLNVSMGGDQVPPPYGEAYIIEPLEKLRSLKKLRDSGQIQFLPTFDIISTQYSQLIENSKDHEGNPIEPRLHTYNSMVTLSRLSDFIEKFYSDVKEHIRFHVFPRYSKEGLFRMYLAAIAQNLPLTDDEYHNLFTIGEGLHEEGGGIDGDPVEKVFGLQADAVLSKQTKKKGVPQKINPYPIRHLVSNGLASPLNTLRFAAAATEPRFHFVASLAKEVVAGDGYRNILKFLQQKVQASSLSPENKEQLRAEIERVTEEGNEKEHDRKGVFFEDLPPSIHAQLGMDVHATYYKQGFDPSLETLVQEGRFEPTGLDAEERTGKRERVEAAFQRIVDAVSHDAYIAHLKKWKDFYKTKETLGGQSLDPSDIGSQLPLSTEEETRAYLGFRF